MPLKKLLRRSIGIFGEALPNWIRQGNILDIKPLRRPLYGCLLWSAEQITCPCYSPYFGPTNLEYGSLLGARDKAEELLPQLEMRLAAQK